MKRVLPAMLLVCSLTLNPGLAASDRDCLARNMYYEARGEPHQGKLAVAQVTLNRARKKNSTFCAVVFEKKQFSWTLRTRTIDYIPKDYFDLAEKIIIDGVAIKDFKATHFHNYKVKPVWSNFVKTGIIGNHIFYEE